MMQRFHSRFTRFIALPLFVFLLSIPSLFAKQPEHRIVSLAPNWTQTVVELGGIDQLVGVSRYSIFPDSIPRMVADGRLKDVGGFLDIDTALVWSLHPDLALTSTQLQRRYHGWLKRQGITVIHVDEKSLEESYNSILALGKFIGREQQAQTMVDTIKTQLAEIAKQYAGQPKIPVYYEINYFYKCVPGADSYITELMKIVGADPIFSDRPGIAPSVTWEEVVKRNPQVILIPWWATAGEEGPYYEGKRAGNGTTTPYRIAHREGADQVDAVKNGKVRYIDSAKTKQAGPMIPTAARLFAKAIHAPGDMQRLNLNTVPKDINDQ